MPEVAGSVVVTIGGDISAFEAALAKAKQQAVAFDAQISAQLNGSGVSAGLDRIAVGVEKTNALLATLTTSSASAGTALTKVAASTTATTAALTEVAAATKLVNAEMASIGTSGGGAAGLAAGTIAARDFAAALEATGGRLDRITPAMLGLATETEAVAAANVRAEASTAGLASGTEAVGVASRSAAASMTALGVAETEAAGLGAGVTREFSVLGAEVARGNFSRIPGSLIVLNERLVSTGTGVLTLGNFMKAFGGLAEVIFNPYVIGFLGLTIGLDLAIKGFDKLVGSGVNLADVLKQQEDQVKSLGNAYGDLAKQADAAVASTANRDAFGISSIASQAQLQIGIAKQTNDVLAQLQYLGGFDGNQTQVYDAFKPFSDAIQHLSDTAAAGTPDVLGFKKMVEEKWALDPTNAELSKAASEIEDLVTKADKGVPSLEALAEAIKKAQTVASQIFDVQGGHPGFDVGTNMLANTISAGNAAAEALKKVQDSLDTTGMSSYARAVANINRQFDDAIVKAHASGAALAAFNQARNLSIQEESLKSLSSINFDAPIAGATEFGAALTSVGTAANGVKVELGNISEPIINITRLFGQAKLDQLIGLEAATTKLHGFESEIVDTKAKLESLSQFSIDKVFGAGSAGTSADISGAYNAIDQIFKRWDAGTASVRDVHDAIETVRASLIALGGDNASVNAFINAIVAGQERVRQLTGDVQTLGNNIKSLPNKTVTITVVTKQVGSGTQSDYSVPNQTGGYSNVGVTRYGAAPGSQSGPSITANQVPSTGYGSQGGSSDGNPTSTVTVTRFATGGMIHPGDTQQVSFFKSPDETVGIFTPGQVQALANPQSGFTGTQPTKEEDRYWTVLMNIEAATQKTAQLLDDIKTMGSVSNSGLSSGSSYGGSSVGSSQTDTLASEYAAVLKQIKANFAANGIVGGGSIGYGGQGLGATPEQIARNIVNGSASPVGSPGANSFENTLTQTQLAQYQSEVRRYQAIYGSGSGAPAFATGGIMGGDTQKVEFFKNPNEKVIIARPDQFADVRPGTSSTTTEGSSQRQISFSQVNHWNGNAPPSKESLASVRRATALGFQDAERAARGR